MKNNSFTFKMLVSLWFLLFTPLGYASSIFDEIANQISENDYTGYVQNLENFGTRYYNTAGNVSAANYIHQTFSGFGLSTDYHTFTHNGSTYSNVVGTLLGSRDPDQVYIIGAHFDSTSNNPQVNAPGADDNASGVAGVLEIASVLSRFTFDSTIRFITFNLEELGLIGSQIYAADAQSRGDQIQAMINLDMIGYTGGDRNEDLELFGDNWLIDRIAYFAGQYTNLPIEKHYGNVGGSDHYYFHSSLYPGSSSLLAVEDTPGEIHGGSNPYYHKTTDRSGNLDFNFAINTTVISALTLAELAQINAIPEPSVITLFITGALTFLLAVKKKGSNN